MAQERDEAGRPSSDGAESALIPLDATLARRAAKASAGRARKAGQPAKEPAPLADVDPVARVLVDIALAHLDRPFDYAVPQTMAEQAVPGARVRVRFAGQDVDGFVLERVAASEHEGRLQPLRRVVSPEPVLTAEVAALTAAVARRYAGTRSDVLRLAVPPRHAATEKRASAPAPDGPVPPDPAARAAWAAYDGGAELLDRLLDRLHAGQAPRAVWSVVPGDDWASLLAEAVVATAAGGRGALVCVPDARDLARLDAALVARWGPGRHAVLSAEAGPAKRYAAFLAAARGAVRVVIGTRAAAFAPVRDLGLVALWDDGDDLLEEPRAPYPHAREVLLTRAAEAGCGFLAAAHARSVEAEYLLLTGWAREVAAPRALVRERVRVTVTGDSDRDLERDPRARSARLPSEVFETVRAALETGPVLVQTPRSGYATRLVCVRCRTPATCTRCHGPLRVPAADRSPECAWCGTAHPAWQCAVCEGRRLRSPALGDRRTAEELGRAFPAVPVRTSAGDHVLAQVPPGPALVVATPGAEPRVEGGYAAVLLLDSWLTLARSDLRAGEEALRRWANAAALVRSPADGGRVLVVGDPAQPALQALVRWDPGGYARREIEERRSAHLPPASRVATVTGPLDQLEPALEQLEAPSGTEVLGPVPVFEAGPQARSGPVAGATGEPEQPDVRFVVRAPRSEGAALSGALAALQASRSAHKLPHLRVEVDPAELG